MWPAHPGDPASGSPPSRVHTGRGCPRSSARGSAEPAALLHARPGRLGGDSESESKWPARGSAEPAALPGCTHACPAALRHGAARVAARVARAERAGRCTAGRAGVGPDSAGSVASSSAGHAAKSFAARMRAPCQAAFCYCRFSTRLHQADPARPG